MLLEARFFTTFPDPSRMQRSVLVILVLAPSWALIQLRYGFCWRDLTRFFYRCETQPLPQSTELVFRFLREFGS
jgi:hypothetical protein